MLYNQQLESIHIWLYDQHLIYKEGVSRPLQKSLKIPVQLEMRQKGSEENPLIEGMLVPLPLDSCLQHQLKVIEGTQIYLYLQQVFKNILTLITSRWI